MNASDSQPTDPPYTLKAAQKDALPQMAELLAQDKHAAHTVESGG